MTEEDRHLGTGIYDPETYWGARAEQQVQTNLQAVCPFGATPDEIRCIDRVQRYMMKSILRGLDLRGKRVLELGCGVGRWVPFFTDYECAWHGVDISEAMLQHGRRTNRDIDFRRVEDGRIPHPDGSFDLVYSVTVVHHNPYDKQESTVREMSRVLKVGGFLLLFEAVADHQTGFNMFPRTVESWVRLAEKTGTRHIRDRGSRFWILWAVSKGISRKLRRLFGLPIRPYFPERGLAAVPLSLWRRVRGRIDAILDPYLQPLLPRSFCRSAVMLFKKPSSR